MSERALEKKERRSMRMVWKSMRLRHVGLAFFWACSMLTFRSSILLSGDANTAGLETIVVIVSFVANMTTLLAMAAWVENDPARIDRLPTWPMGALVVAGLLLIASSGAVGGVAMLPLLFGGAVLAGAGYGYFWGSWADCYGRMHPSRTSFYLPVAFFLTAALFLAISLLTEYLGVPAVALMLPLPIISLACLRRCQAETPDGRAARSEGTKRSLAALGSLLGLIVASLVLSCLFGFVWEMTVFSVGSVNDAHLVPLFANLVVAAALIGIVLYARTRIDLGMAYRIVVPIIVVLFAVLPFFWDTNPIALNIIMSASYGVFDVVIWSLVAATSYDFAVSGFIIGGIVRALSILLRLVGIGIGYLIMLVPDNSSMLIVALSIGALYVLVMLGLFYALKWRRRKPVAIEAEERDLAVEPEASGAESESERLLDGAEAPEDVRENDRASLYAELAEDYGLTRREAEVLPYLARGRSAKVIADALFVSESTVRTHTRRILEKTDLHSKQQVIDLIEKYE